MFLTSGRTMSHRSQLFNFSAHDTTSPQPIVASWGSSPGNLEDVSSRDATLLRSMLGRDSMVQTGFEPRRINWGAVLGLTLATAVSAGIWTGIVLLVARIWK
jgi:hypothetical protein